MEMIPVGHMVFFKLKESTPAGRAKLAESCRKYLRDLPGVLHFSVGVLPAKANEPNVNDRDFDVSLHLVFANMDALTAYVKHPQHTQFVDENKAAWAGARVFDSDIVGAIKAAK